MSKTKHFEDIIASQGRLIYTNKGDSMFPFIQPRDLLVIEKAEQPLKRWDIPLYKRDSGQYVLHRIVDINENGYVMCGDNRSQCEYGVLQRQIIGSLTAIIREGDTIPVEQIPNPSVVKAADDLLYLVSCAVNERQPSPERCKAMYLPSVYGLASAHYLTSAAAIALEQVMPLPHAFDQSKKKAIRKLSLFDIEREDILRAFDEAGIWHVPLKGIVIKELYPKSAMREMSDNDILCDPSKMGEIKALMERKGYVCNRFEELNHDEYSKPPTLEFEMHHSLFVEKEMPRFAKYYADIKERLEPVGGCGCRFGDEDFYIYMLCHMYKHYTHAGTGLRSLLDIYVYLRAKPGLDRVYLHKELKKLRLDAFEKEMRDLAQKVFTLQPLSEREHKELMRFVFAGTYGTEERMEYSSWLKRLGDDSRSSKRRYFWKRVFISGDSLRECYPFVARHKMLYPFLIVYRPFKGVFTHPNGIIREIKALNKFKKKD